MSSWEIPESESLIVELKSDKNRLPDKDLVLAAVCLANTDGGIIYLGVENDGRPTGLHPDHRDITGMTAMIANRTVPPLSVRAALVDLRGKQARAGRGSPIGPARCHLGWHPSAQAAFGRRYPRVCAIPPTRVRIPGVGSSALGLLCAADRRRRCRRARPHRAPSVAPGRRALSRRPIPARSRRCRARRCARPDPHGIRAAYPNGRRSSADWSRTGYSRAHPDPRGGIPGP